MIRVSGRRHVFAGLRTRVHPRAGLRAAGGIVVRSIRPALRTEVRGRLIRGLVRAGTFSGRLHVFFDIGVLLIEILILGHVPLVARILIRLEVPALVLLVPVLVLILILVLLVLLLRHDAFLP